MTSEQSKKIADRLDGLVSTLASARAPLDDLTRARVAARLQARLQASGRARVRRRWMIGGALAASVIAVVGAGWLARGPARPVVAVAPVEPVAHDVVPVPAPAPAPSTDGELTLTHQAGALRGEVDGASLTLYGGGHATRHGRRVAIDAEAVVVDRSAAPTDAPELQLTVRAVRVRMQRATFSVDSSPVRVTVIRGEIILSCPGTADEKVVHAGDALTCEGEAHHVGSAAPPSSIPAPVPAPAAPSSGPVPAPAAPSSRPALAIAHAPEKRAPASEPIDDLGARYAAAEQLMARDPRAARAALRALIDAAPTGAYAAPALLDLARLAHAGGDLGTARTALDELARQPGAAALAMPAAYLRCKLASSDADHRRCLAAFRIAFPHSPRDAEALAELAASAGTAGDCAAARPLVDEYLRAYPTGASRRAMQAWRARCAPSP